MRRREDMLLLWGQTVAFLVLLSGGASRLWREVRAMWFICWEKIFIVESDSQF